MRLLVFVVFSLFSAFMYAQGTLKIVDKLILEKAYDEAEMELLSALDSSSDPMLKDKLGEVYGYQAKWDAAIDIYAELTEANTRNADYFFRYGGVLAKKAQNTNKLAALTLIGKIKKSFKKSVELNPNHIKAHWALVDLYVSLPGIVGGSNSKAQKYAQKLQGLSKIDGYLARGYVYEYDEQPELAKEMFLKALDLVDELSIVNSNQLHYQIGKVCGDYNRKLDLGIRQMRSYIDNYTVLDGVPLEWAYFRMAKLYRKKGQKNQALVWANKALAIKKEFRPALEEKKKILDFKA